MRQARFGRALLVALAIGASLGIPGVPAAAAASVCPTSAPCVVVHFPQGTEAVVSGQEISSWANAAAGAANGVSQQQYQTRISSGGSVIDNPFVNIGLSVNALLGQLGIKPSEVFTEMTRPRDGSPDGSLTSLSTAELAAPSSFIDGLLPAFYLDGSNQIFYVRPLRDDSDVNAYDDEIETTPGGSIDLYVYNGQMLQVSANSSPANPSAGHSVIFSASATPDGESPQFDWTFSDGGTATGSIVTHTFTAGGTYDAHVDAIGAADSFGAADLSVTVAGGPAPSSSPSPTSGGGHSGPPRTPQPGPSSGTGHQPSGRPTPRPLPSEGIDLPPGSVRDGRSSVVLPPFDRYGLPRGVELTSTLTGSPPLLAAGSEPLVEGRLLSDGGSVLVQGGSSSVEAGTAPVGKLSVRWRGAGLVGSIAAIMLLFAGGAARELRRPKRSMMRLRSVVRPR